MVGQWVSLAGNLCSTRFHHGSGPDCGSSNLTPLVQCPTPAFSRMHTCTHTVRHNLAQIETAFRPSVNWEVLHTMGCGEVWVGEPLRGSQPLSVPWASLLGGHPADREAGWELPLQVR